MKILLIIFIWLSNFLIGDADKSLRFQKDSSPTINSTAFNFLDFDSNELIEVSSFSLSLWFKVDYFRPSTYVFSYSISDSKSNQLNLRFDDDAVFFVIDEISLKISNRNFFPNQWYSMVAVLSEDPQNLKFYINRELVFERNLPDISIPLNGTIVLGQETDSHEGGFADMQSFCGWISHFNIYNRALTSNEIKTITNHKTAGDLQGDIVSWEKANWKLNGIVEEEDVELWSTNQTQFTLICEPLTIESSRAMCMKLFRTPIYIPRSRQENAILYNRTKSFPPKCKSPNYNGGYLWLGATDKWENGNWKTFEGEKLNWTNFASSGTAKSQECLALLFRNNPGKWDDAVCSRRVKLCPVCEINFSTSFTLRGLCEDDSIHSLFMPSTEITEKLSFKGFTRFNIQYDAEMQSWFLTDTWKNKTVAKLSVPNLSYPIGTREWEIIENYEICDLPKGENKVLSLANCEEGEFNCDDGACIPMDKRCDLRTDCSDRSDENHCDRLIKPEYYLSDLVAPGNNGHPLNANLSVTVTRIFDVDVRVMKVFMDLVVSVSWFDRRLSFRNLKNISDYNVISTDDIWIPKLEYLDTDSKDFFESSPSLLVTKMGTPAEDDLSNVKSDEIFDGDTNYLTISWKISVPLHCDMFLYAFPFDEQKCKLKLKLKSSRTELINWGKVIPFYTGTRLITEYEVKPLQSSISTDEFGYSIGSIEIPLSRRYSYYITTAYVPTYMLVLISYMSFFCKTEHVDLRVMMTITTLLVLYSLYQQIEASLPKTAYTKAVDVWCFFCLIIIMTQVIFHIVLELNFRRKLNQKNKEPKDASSTENLADGDEDEPEWRKGKMLFAGQFLYAIIQVLFVVVYVIVLYFELYSDSTPPVI